MLTRTLLIVLVMSLLSACGAVATPAPIPTNTAVPPFTQTPVPPTATPTATPVPSPTPDPLLFRDDFEGALDPAWHWIAEKPAYWSLTTEPGWLRMSARAGWSNFLVQPAPTGNYDLETKVNFRPGGNYQIAALVIYQSDTDRIALGRAFCGNANGCSGDGFYMDATVNGNLNLQNFSTKAPDVDVVYLRLRNEFKHYSGYYSIDGQNWTLIGRHERGPMNPMFVGLVAGQAMGSVPRVASFDYFTITALK